MNKKGISKVYINAFLAIAATAVIIFTVHLYVTNTLNLHTDTHNLEFELLNRRILTIMSAEDTITGTPNTGTIDPDKFTEEILENNIERENLGIKITLTNFDDKTKKEIFYNKDFFERYSGPFRNINNIQKKTYVTVHTDTGIQSASLELQTVFAKRRT